jgi:PAS domain S-box-containing protein
MFPFATIADQILRTATGIVRTGDFEQLAVLDLLPVAIYVTDADGFISYFNPACIAFSGREPMVGRDRWCVSWKIYTDEGQFLPHDQCPMAVAIQTRQAIRGATAVAERPDGSRVNFEPFPTPVIDANDRLLGAVNMLIDITGGHRRLSRYPDSDARLQNDKRIQDALATFSIEDLAKLIEELEMELGPPIPRTLN